MAERKYFSANTVEQAVLMAARHYRVSPEELAYEQIEKRHGFIRNRKRVLIQVDPNAPTRTGAAQEAPAPRRTRHESAPAPRAASGREERPAPRDTSPPTVEEAADEDLWDREEPEELVVADEEPRERIDEVAEEFAEELDGEESWDGPTQRITTTPPPAAPRPARAATAGMVESATEAARTGVRHLFDLAGLELDAAVEEGEEGLLELEITGPDQELLLKDRGRVLMACQHLLPRLIRGLTGTPSPCRLDSDNFHEVRAEQLRDLAQRIASEVRQEGRAQTLEPMAPDERRIVHMTLADDVGVTTESKGQGLFKRVVVSPVETRRRRPRGFDPYRRR